MKALSSILATLAALLTLAGTANDLRVGCER
jgi:hypothetical protein